MTFFSRILITLINIPISMIIARKLGPEGQGAYSAMMAFTSLWGTTLLLGVDSAHTYFLAGKRYSLQQVVTHTIIWSILLGLIATPAYYFMTPLLGDSSSLLQGVLTISTATVPFILLKYFTLSIFLGRERLELFNLINVLSNLTLLGLLVVFVWFRPGGVELAVWAYLASLAVFAVLSLLWVRRQLVAEGGFRWCPSRKFFREGLFYGIRGHMGNLVAQLTLRFDQVMITSMVGLEAQGLYSVAVIVAEKLTHISISVQMVLFPRVSALDTKQANALTPVVCRLTITLVALAAIVLYFLGEILIELLYGGDFLPALVSMRILLPGITLLTLSKLLAGDLSGRDRRFALTLATSIAFLVNLALNLAWIPRHGIVGAAWASNVAYVVQTGTLAILFWRVSGITPWELLRPRRSDWTPVWKLILRRNRAHKA